MGHHHLSTYQPPHPGQSGPIIHFFTHDLQFLPKWEERVASLFIESLNMLLRFTVIFFLECFIQTPCNASRLTLNWNIFLQENIGIYSCRNAQECSGNPSIIHFSVLEILFKVQFFFPLSLVCLCDHFPWGLCFSAGALSQPISQLYLAMPHINSTHLGSFYYIHYLFLSHPILQLTKV